ncbi:hypothetical protein AVEN_187591-1 [Araneus ventricosus]|uniref:Uncharacterized protein n=1 Tax=Araneus ventricosus TaxID=182803 RepID=A0A4Y2FR56_ARAVE|nr:hypothetical protein AVEN_187591-1 [Araneus ventricosus]
MNVIRIKLEQIDGFMIYPQDNNHTLRLAVWFFCFLICINTIINVARVTTVSAIILNLQTISTFGYFNQNNTPLSFSPIECFLKVISGSFNVIFLTLPPIVAVTLFLLLIQVRNVLRGYLRKLEGLIRRKDVTFHLRSFIVDFTKAVVFLKGIIEILSPLTFVLTAFWTTGIFYNLSKMLYNNYLNDIFNFASASCYAFNYTIHFLILVVLSSEIPAVVFKMRSVVLQETQSQDYLFVDETKCASINLFISKLEHLKEEMTVTVMGMFKLERSVILVSLGAGISYELLLVQLMEK